MSRLVTIESPSRGPHLIDADRITSVIPSAQGPFVRLGLEEPAFEMATIECVERLEAGGFIPKTARRV